MKRIKMMLLSFALLAVVGGALAFKAKFSGYDKCYTTTLNAPSPSCPDLGAGFTNIINPGDTPFTIYTTDKIVTEVGTPAQCQFQDNQQTPLTVCTTSVSITVNQ